MRDFYIVGIGCLILGFLMGILIVPERVEIRVVEVPGKQETNFHADKMTVYASGEKWHAEIKNWRGLTTVETEAK